MKLKPTPLDIPEDDPFKNDVLGRKPLVESLTTLACDVTPPFVLCVESSWGTGKTTFLRLWQAYLKKMEVKNVTSLYFNAWETDFAVDPLVAFVGEMSVLAKAKTSGEKAAKRIAAIKDIGAKLARRALPAAIKIATAGVLDATQFTEEVSAGAAADLMGDVIEEYEKNKKLIEKFRTALTDLVKTLPHESDEPRLLVFVDELDRCRPNYALSLLERIKHLFNTPNVVFVLALDKRQLCASIEATYGGRIDSEDYLRRFVDLGISLKGQKNSRRFAECLFNQFDFQGIFKGRTGEVTKYDAQNLMDAFIELSSLLGLSLRVQEQCFARFYVAVLSTPNNYHLYPELLVLLSVMRVVARDVYDKYISVDGTPTDVIGYIKKKSGGNDFLESRIGLKMEAIIIAAKIDRYGQKVPDELTKYRELAKKEQGENAQTNTEKERAASVIDYVQHLQRYSDKPDLEYVVAKVELVKEEAL